MKEFLPIHKKNGFTLLENLLVVTAIAILAGTVIIAIIPNKQLSDPSNAKQSVAISIIR